MRAPWSGRSAAFSWRRMRATVKNGISRFVSAASDPSYDFAPDAAVASRMSVADVQRLMRRTVLDTTEVRGLRWEFLLGGMSLAPCTDMRQVLFGADSTHRAMIDESRSTLVRSASDSILFSFVEQTVENRRMLREGVPIVRARGGFIARGWTLLTGRPVLESCAAMFF